MKWGVSLHSLWVFVKPWGRKEWKMSFLKCHDPNDTSQDASSSLYLSWQAQQWVPSCKWGWHFQDPQCHIMIVINAVILATLYWVALIGMLLKLIHLSRYICILVLNFSWWVEECKIEIWVFSKPHGIINDFCKMLLSTVSRKLFDDLNLLLVKMWLTIDFFFLVQSQTMVQWKWVLCNKSVQIMTKVLVGV